MSPLRTSTQCDKGRASQCKRKENTAYGLERKKERKYNLHIKYNL